MFLAPYRAPGAAQKIQRHRRIGDVITPIIPDTGDIDLDFSGLDGTDLRAYSSLFSTLGSFELLNNELIVSSANTTEELDAIALVNPPSTTFKLETRFYLGTEPSFHTRIGVAFLGGSLQDFYYFRLQTRDSVERALLRKRLPNAATGISYFSGSYILRDNWNDVVLFQRDLGSNRYQIEIWVNNELAMLQTFRSPAGIRCGFVVEETSITNNIDVRVDHLRVSEYTEVEIRQELETATLTNFNVLSSTNPEIVGTNSTDFTASSGRVASLASDQTTGSVAFDFDGPNGNYDVVVGYLANAEGAPSANLNLNSTDYPWIFYRSGENENKEIVFSNIALTNGDTLTLTGDKDGNEFPKFDYVRFLPPSTGGASESSVRFEAETDFDDAQNSTFNGDETNASNGFIVRLKAGETTATLTYTYTGASGTYSVRLGYLDEDDQNGEITYSVDINGRTETALSQTAPTRTANSAKWLNWPINNGDVISVTMTSSVTVGSGTHKGRFDYVDIITPAAVGVSTYEGRYGSGLPEGVVADQVGAATGGGGDGSGGGGDPSDPNPNLSYWIVDRMDQQYNSNRWGAQLPSLANRNLSYDDYSVVNDPSGALLPSGQPRKCWRFELRDDSQTPEVNSGMRVEFRLKSQFRFDFDEELWFGYSIFLDDTHNPPFDTGLEGLGQWHASSSGNGGPPLIIYNEDGYWSATIRGSGVPEERRDRYDRRVDFPPFRDYGNIKRNVWTNFIVRVIFNFRGNGLTEMWIDGQKYFRDIGTNCYNDDGRIDMKVGNYKVGWKGSRKSNKTRKVCYYRNLKVIKAKDLNGVSGYDAVNPAI